MFAFDSLYPSLRWRKLEEEEKEDAIIGPFRIPNLSVSMSGCPNGCRERYISWRDVTDISRLSSPSNPQIHELYAVQKTQSPRFFFF